MALLLVDEGLGEGLADRAVLRPDQQVDVGDLVALADQGLAHHEGTRHTRLSSFVVDRPPGRLRRQSEPGHVRRAQAIRWREWRSRRRGAAARTLRRAPAEPGGGRRRRAAGVRARGERGEARQHHAAPRLRRHVLRGHAAQRDRARAGARPGRRARRRRDGARRGARDAPRRRRQHEPRASRCCWRRSRARRCSAGRCASASRRYWARSTLDDARAAYAAIRAAGAGGLDEPVEHDVREEPTVEAARGDGGRRRPRRDRRRVRERLRGDVRARAAGAGPRARRRAAAARRDGRACLRLLAAVPDTLVARKRGRAAAERVSAGAARVLAAGGVRSDAGGRRWRRSTPRCARTATRSIPARRPTSSPRCCSWRCSRACAVILLVSRQRAHARGAGAAGGVRRHRGRPLRRPRPARGCARAVDVRDLGGRGGMAALVDAAERIRADAWSTAPGSRTGPTSSRGSPRARTLLGCAPATLAARARSGAARRLAARRRASPIRARSPPPRRRRAPTARAAGCASRCAAAAAAACGSGAAGALRGRRRGPGAHRRRCRARRPRSADGRSAALLGVSEQLIGRRALGARGYAWCGNVVPPRLPAAERARAGRCGAGDLRAPRRRVRPARPVRRGRGLGRRAGVGGRGQPAPDRVAGDDRGGARRAPVRGAPRGVRRTAARRAASAEPPAAAGKAVVFATADVRMPDTRGWPARGIRDVPHPGEPIAAGHPICTLLATGRARRPCSPTSRRAPPRCAPSSTTARRSMPSPDAAGRPARGCGLRVRRHRGGRRRRRRLERLDRTCPLGDAWFAERVAPAPPLARVDGREAGARPGARRGGGDPRAGAGAARLRARPDDAARRSAPPSRWPRRSAR